MPCSRPSRFAFVSGLVALTLLAACGKDRAPASAPPPPAATRGDEAAAKPVPARTVKTAPAAVPLPAAAAASTAFHVSAVNLGHEVNAAREITQPGNQFASDEKTIYASVVTAGITADASLNARWNYLEGAGQLITSVTQRIATDGPATTTFTLQNPDLWPEGKYNVQISVDGKVVDTQAFTIGKPAP